MPESDTSVIYTCITEFLLCIYNLPITAITACACRKQSLDRVRSIVEANPSTMDVSRLPLCFSYCLAVISA